MIFTATLTINVSVPQLICSEQLKYNSISADFRRGRYCMVEGVCCVAEERLRARCVRDYPRRDSR